jgi:GNAT superfamily N-acetyltransferase
MTDTTNLRTFRPAADHSALEALWQAALAPTWPLLPTAIARIKTGLVAERRGSPVGLAALDEAGSIPLLLVHPAHQRQGVGSTLLDAALAELAARGADRVSLGGGDNHIWPGVPTNLPAAAFFAARGWHWDRTVADLTRDLRGYRTPAGVHARIAQAGFTVAPADGDRAQVLAFEATHFPRWLRRFDQPGTPVLAARDARGHLAGTLLFHGPDPDLLYAPLLGPAPGNIACVGVADHARNRGVGTALVARACELLRDAGTRTCLIDWTTRESFYGRLGYLPWRRYLMSRRSLPTVDDLHVDPHD